MKKTHKILGGILLISILFFSTLVLTLVLKETVELEYGTKSLVEYEKIDNLTEDRILNLGWSNSFDDYDGNGGAAEVVIAVYVPTDYGVTMARVDLTDNSDGSQGSNFQVYNVSLGNCSGLNAVAGREVWRTNCTLITINGTLETPTKDVGFNLSIDINLSDDCVNTTCVNENYQLMFSDLITYKKEVDADCSFEEYNGAPTYNSTSNLKFCYFTENNTAYSCIVEGNPTGTAVPCNITKGIGKMANETDIMKQGTTGRRVHVPEEAEIEFTINLKQGWNLVSIPVVPENDSMAAVLASIDGKYNQVTRFNSTSQQSETYTYGAPSHLQAFNTVSPGLGYWILATEDANLTINGTQPQQTSIDLKAGWNLIGPLFSSERAISSDALLSIDGKYNQVTRFNSTSQQSETYTYGAPLHLQEFTTMGPGLGYWILATEDTTLNI